MKMSNEFFQLTRIRIPGAFQRVVECIQCPVNLIRVPVLWYVLPPVVRSTFVEWTVLGGPASVRLL